MVRTGTLPANDRPRATALLHHGGRLPSLASALLGMLRNMVIGDLALLPAPLKAASGSLRDGVTGLDVNGRTKCSIYGYD